MSGEQVAAEIEPVDARPVAAVDRGRRIQPSLNTGPAPEGYRADIDGLRAIAVAMVLIYHTGISPLRGGFIGVDVFFVISGFLITRLLRSDLERGSFTVSRFYERRVRRILPALTVVLAVTLAIAPFMLFPLELKRTAMTAIATLASASNLYLLQSAGYFSADVASQPLIHTWSLGVEEQFYLGFPLFMQALSRLPATKTRLAIAVVMIVSLGGGVVLTQMNRDFAFYFPLTRAWELLLGALLAYVSVPRLKPILAETVAGLALALLLTCGYKLHSGLAFPGIYALVPCAATAIVIAIGAHNTSLVKRLLSSSPFVWFGKISYSVYLWHWPILIYYQLGAGRTLDLLEAFGLCVASTLAAYLSWRYVEQPFRDRRILSSRRSIWQWASISCVALGVFSCGLWIYSGLNAQAESNRLAAYLEYDDAPVYRRGTCFLFGHLDRLSDFDRGSCMTPSSKNSNLLLVGDSHAAHLWSGLHKVLTDTNVMQATSTGCKPVIPSKGERTCTDLIGMALGPFIQRNRIDVLVLSARWIGSDVPDVERTIRTLRSKVGKIVVFGPIVEYDLALPRLLGQTAWRGNGDLLLTGRNPEQLLTDRLLSDAVRSGGADYVSTYSFLCPDPALACVTEDNGVPVQWDYGHLTAKGSELIAERAYATGALSKKP